MNSKKKETRQKKPRNLHALNAIQRHAGPMQNTKKDLTDDYMQQCIPQGLYCYDENGTCPWWSIDSTKRNQENGYCSYMNKGDWQLSIGLLWDQCKECGVNMEYSKE